MGRRVVVTGFGCVTALGSEADRVWNCLTAGCSGAGPITLFDADNFPVRIAAEVRDADRLAAGRELPAWSSRQTLFSMVSALDAARHAGLEGGVLAPHRAGVYLGCGEVYPEFTRFAQWLASSLDEEGLDARRLAIELRSRTRLREELDDEPDVSLLHIAGLLGIQGPAVNYTTACVSSSVAIGEAGELIRDNAADVMFAGGAHSMIHPFGITGFDLLSTLSRRNDSPQTAYRPFDRDRDGFVVGEGGCVVVLEEAEHARRRGAEIYGELSGYASTHDAFRITDPRPDGSAASRCIREALRHARVEPQEVGYVNAHGSGTVLNDRIETLALKQALGRYAYRTPISSSKSMLGHLTTACGAIEFLVCLLAQRHQVAPPTINCDHPDPDCDLDYVPNEARQIRCDHAVNNNLGFGGHNVALVVSRYTG